jgi:hypothetical protein
MKTFSQRKGIVPISEVIQTDSMSIELRNSLWNALDSAIWSTTDFLWVQYGQAQIVPFAKTLWFHHFKKPMDAIPERADKCLAQIRAYFFDATWNEVYDFLEFVVKHYEGTRRRLAEILNVILARELSGYRFVDGVLVDVTSKDELQMLEEALADTRFSGTSAHLKRALELYASRESPDYRNSIKESISAVEAIARVVAENPKATLGDALKAIEKRGKLHQSLKEGFLKIYGYTSDEGGIRHAMLDEPQITANDAKYFLLSCTSFCNYLKAQVAQ